MCAVCAMAAMTGASGARSWLQTRHTTWLTPRRMKVATIGLFTAAAIGSSVTVSGSTPAHPAHPAHHAPPPAPHSAAASPHSP